MIVPLDTHGVALSAFDIVRLLRLPDYILEDADTDELRAMYRAYEGRYGLIKYARQSDADGWRKWQGQNGLVLIEVTKVAEDVITSYEFVVPPSCIEKLPYNSIIMNLFSNFDWQIHWDSSRSSGESDHPIQTVEWPIKKGTELFEVLKEIIEAPYEKLVAAHDAAAAIIPFLRSK